jgi:hypothetical protein
MHTFQRTTASLIKGLALSLGGSAAAALLVYVFTDSFVALAAVGVVLCAALLYITLFSEAIRLEVEQSTLRFFQRGKLRHEIDLAQHSARYVIRTKNGSTQRVNLYFAPLAGGSELCLDCEPLGRKQFDALWALLEQHCEHQNPANANPQQPE